jgi:hypothetical protein
MALYEKLFFSGKKLLLHQYEGAEIIQRKLITFASYVKKLKF